MKKLHQIASIRMGYPFRSRIERDESGAIAVIQMKDIDDSDLLHLENAIRINLVDFKDHHVVRKGDLVFRSRGKSNSVALVSVELGMAVLAAPMLLIRPDDVDVLPAYLHWYINLPTTQIALAAQAEGTSVRMISKAALEDLEIPIPNRQEQELIVRASEMAIAEQKLLEQITRERRRLADGVLLRYAMNA